MSRLTTKQLGRRFGSGVMTINIQQIKRELLQETNYRCGYCMRNITPKMYYIDEEATQKTPVFDYTYRKIYNIHDRAHIEPNSDIEDDFKDYYNLIALCKQCHWEIDKPKMLNITELKRQKLYWMTANGRFTRFEIDLLMKLYNNMVNRKEFNKIQFPYIERIIELDGSKYNTYSGNRSILGTCIELIPTNIINFSCKYNKI